MKGWLLTVLAAAFLLALSIGAVDRLWESTSTDRFCARCHGMHPYFAAHRAGPHGDLACRRCHIGEEPLPALAAKLDGARFLALHHLGGGHHPQAVVPSRTCQEEGCHPRGGRDSLPWRGLLFHHSRHLSTGRFALGEKARCTLCHGRSLSAGHGVEVRREACYLCHLKDGWLPAGEERDQACLVCHSLPPAMELGGGAVIDHGKAWEQGHRCGDCHRELFTTGGEVTGAACRECHSGKPELYLEQDWFIGRVHYQHGRLLSVDCNRCHGPVKHQAIAFWQEGFPAAGERCSHVGGSGARAFLRLDCAFCHQGEEGGALRQGRCGLCHLPREVDEKR